jgi:hypothetical protein
MMSAVSGHHLHDDHHDDERPPTVEAELRERERREEREQEREQRHDDHDDQAVLHDRPEVLAVDRVGEVAERRRVREELRRVALDVDPRLEGRVHHPVDREDHHDEHQHAEQVDADPAGQPAMAADADARHGALDGRRDGHRRGGHLSAHRTSPTRHICRM